MMIDMFEMRLDNGITPEFAVKVVARCLSFLKQLECNAYHAVCRVDVRGGREEMVTVEFDLSDNTGAIYWGDRLDRDGPQTFVADGQNRGSTRPDRKKIDISGHWTTPTSWLAQPEADHKHRT